MRAECSTTSFMFPLQRIRPLVFAALLVCSLGGCKTTYSDVYSYRPNRFVRPVATNIKTAPVSPKQSDTIPGNPALPLDPMTLPPAPAIPGMGADPAAGGAMAIPGL